MMTRLSLALLVVLFAAGCAHKAAPLTPDEEKLVKVAGVSSALALEAKSLGTGLRQLEGTNDNGDPQVAHGLTIDVPEADAASAAEALRKVGGGEYVAFVSDRNYGIEDKPDQVSIMKTRDPFEVLRVMGTNGVNHEIDNAAVIARLRAWDKRYGLTFTGISYDWVEVKLAHAPDDWAVFADEVYAFCPDVVDQGVETISALARDMEERQSVYLWWD
jgi:hypothetical protein